MTERSHGVTRREVLTRGVGVAAAALLAGCGTNSKKRTPSRAACVAPQGKALEAIEHVVFVMQENRSFDQYYGAFPGAKGFDDHRGSQLGAFSQPWPGGPATSNGVLLPYALDAATMAAQCAGNSDIPIHDWAPQHLSWNDGKMDRFVAVHSEQANDGAGEGPLVMAHQQQSDLPFYWSLAEQFTICDAYHCSVIGPTMPNRLYMWSGMIDPAGTGGGPIVSTPGFAESAGVIGTCDWKTVPEALTDASVSWKVYQPPNTSVGPTMSENLAIGFNALLYFKQYVEDPNSELYKNAFLPSWPDDFAADVQTGKLPQVSWLVPSLIDSEHPSAPPLNGQY